MSALAADVKEAGAGGGDGRTVVFLHGFGGVGAVWDGIREKLPDGVRSIAYDLPGHGGSLHFPEAGPPKTAVKAIVADLAERRVGPVHFVGHSMGGAIATLIALSAPDVVSSLTLLAPGGYGPEIAADTLARFAEAVTPDQISAALAVMSGPGHRPASAEVAALAAARAAPGQTDMLKRIVGLITRDGKQGVIPATSLAKLTMPVSVLWGRDDTVLPFTQSGTLPPQFGLHAFSDTGHMLIEERPDMVSLLVRHAIR